VDIYNAVRIIVAEATDKLYTPLIFLIVIFAPLQGFFNALIYLRPKIPETPASSYN
jgi:hypothetical protein